MSVERVRLIGGALQGQVMWLEPSCATLNVHIGGQSPGATKTLHYRRTGGVLCFVGETETAPTQPVEASRAT